MRCEPAMWVEAGKPASFRLKDVPIEPMRDGCVRVRPRVLGDCPTTQAVAEGKYFRPVPGRAGNGIVVIHEAVAEATADMADDVTGIVAGRLYALKVRRPNPDDPDRFGRAGRVDLSAMPHYVEYGLVGADGFGRPSLVLPADMLVPLPDGLPADVAVFMDLLACVHKAVREGLGVRAVKLDGLDLPARRAAVLGAGPAGLLASMLYKSHGQDVTVFDVAFTAEKARAVHALGATAVEVPDTLDAAALGPFVDEMRRTAGPFDFLFQATSEPWLGCLWLTVLDTAGVVVNFGIPDRAGAVRDEAFYDRARAKMTGNLAETNAINASDSDWAAAAGVLRENSAFARQLLHPRVEWGNVSELLLAPSRRDSIKTHLLMP